MSEYDITLTTPDGTDWVVREDSNFASMSEKDAVVFIALADWARTKLYQRRFPDTGIQGPPLF